MNLDHLVIAVTDLARAVEDYRTLGFTVAMGGRHPGRTSHNALVVFDDGAYLELIAWAEPGPAERWYLAHAKHGDGLMDYALVPDDIAQSIQDAKSRGVPLTGPVDGGRLRPDGVEVKWRTGRQATFDLPFLCGDVTPRELRVPEGAARRHANGATGVARVAVAVHDLDVSIARYTGLLGHAAEMGAPESVTALGVRMATAQVGATAIVLMSPQAGGGALPRFAAELAARLAGRGEGPHAVSLRTASPTRRRLDPALTHGVPMELA